MSLREGMMGEEKVYSTQEAAEKLGVHPQTLKNWIYEGKIKTKKTVGGRHRIKETQLKYLRNLPEIDLIEQLLHQFVDDIAEDKDPWEAGWIEIHESEVEELDKKGLIENPKQHSLIRITPRIGLKDKIKDEYGERAFERLEKEGALSICSRGEIAWDIVKFIDYAIDDSLLQLGIFVIGWERMLRTSGFPASIDLVLEEGFSPEEWNVQSVETTWELAHLASREWWDTESPKEAIKALENEEMPTPAVSEGSNLNMEGVKKVLGWDELLKVLGKEESLTLAFPWYADYLCEENGVPYPEGFLTVQEGTWRTLEEKFTKNRSDMISEVQEAVEELEERVEDGRLTTALGEIIRYPW